MRAGGSCRARRRDAGARREPRWTRVGGDERAVHGAAGPRRPRSPPAPRRRQAATMTPPEPMSIFDADQLAACVQCGFCLSSCPTYETTHLEEHGPRGRILAMRLVQDGELSIDDPDVVDSLESCVQCRACEAVCPSLVEFGSLMETARTAITSTGSPTRAGRSRPAAAVRRPGAPLDAARRRGSAGAGADPAARPRDPVVAASSTTCPARGHAAQLPAAPARERPCAGTPTCSAVVSWTGCSATSTGQPHRR
jgi:heterodisulfide reductase subunit C